MKIAVYGKLRAGKTEACNYISQKLDCDVFEFSKGVQEVIDVIYPETKGTKNRELLVSVGQHLRKLDENVWVNIVKNKILNSEKPNILVAGVRQENEFEMLKELGFTFIQIEASETTRVERCMAQGDSFKLESLRDHTEMVMDNYKPDYLILNEYGFKELEISINNVLSEILGQELKEVVIREGLKDYRKRMGLSDEG